MLGQLIKEAGKGAIEGSCFGALGGAVVIALSEVSATAVLKSSSFAWMGYVLGAIEMEGNKLKPHDRNLIIRNFIVLGSGLGLTNRLAQYLFIQLIEQIEQGLEKIGDYFMGFVRSDKENF